MALASYYITKNTVSRFIFSLTRIRPPFIPSASNLGPISTFQLPPNPPSCLLPDSNLSHFHLRPIDHSTPISNSKQHKDRDRRSPVPVCVSLQKCPASVVQYMQYRKPTRRGWGDLVWLRWQGRSVEKEGSARAL